MNNILLDTGPLIAILDKRDKAHKRCVFFVKGFRGNLLMTEPVLTEAAYLLRSAKYFKNIWTQKRRRTFEKRKYRRNFQRA